MGRSRRQERRQERKEDRQVGARGSEQPAGAPVHPLRIGRRVGAERRRLFALAGTLYRFAGVECHIKQ